MLRKLFSFIFALILLFSCFAASAEALSPVNALSVTETLSPVDSPSELFDVLISESAVLMDGDTGQVLFEKDMHQPLRPASITKVMTALLALEHGNLDDVLTVTQSSLRGIEPTAARISVIPNEELTLEDALYGIAVVSAADASNVVAEYVSGSVNEFISLMNERAKELGALNTNFVNTHGMPDDNHLTTAYDMALISMAAINTPGFNEIFNAHRYVMPPTNVRSTPRTFRNLNRMMTGDFYYEDLISGKTGWTRSSQYTLFAAAERDGRKLVGILIKSPLIDDKYEDMTLMFEYGFDAFERVTFSREELERFSIRDARGRDLVEDVTVHGAFSCLLHRYFTKDDIGVEYIFEDYVSDEDDSEFDDDGEIGDDSEFDDDGEIGLDDGDETDDDSEFDDDRESGHEEQPPEVQVKEVQARIVFTLNASSFWHGVTELGEVTGTARLLDYSEYDEFLQNQELLNVEPEPKLEEPEPEEPALIAGEQANEDADIKENRISEELPEWVSFVRDISLIMVLIVIVLCFVINKKRRVNRR